MPNSCPADTTHTRAAPSRTVEDALYDCGCITAILTTLGSAEISGVHDLCGTSIQFLDTLLNDRLATIRNATEGTGAGAPKPMATDGDGVAASTGDGTAAPADDATLIRLCGTLDQLERAYLATDFKSDEPDAEGERDAIRDSQEAIVEAIYNRPPHTLDGFKAVARSLALWMGRTTAFAREGACTDERLLATILRGACVSAGAA